MMPREGHMGNVRSENGDVAKVERLLAKTSDLNATDENGNTPLVLAASDGHARIAELLLHAGASSNVSGVHESTPLHWAAHRGDVKVAQMLIEAGAQVNALMDDGRPPLHLAALQGDLDMVRFLLGNGANAKSNLYMPGRFRDPNVSGLSPSDLAQKRGHIEVATLIRNSEDINS